MGIFSLPAVIINSGPDFTGCIVMWLGSVGSIPSGWALCDGNNGTPNLTGKFLYGWDTANSIDIGDTGGTTDRAHIHSVSSDGSHTHTTGGGQHAHVSDRPLFTGSGSYADANSGNVRVYTKDTYSFEAAHSHGTTGSASHSHTISGGSDPSNKTVLYIMRIRM